ncbi:MAG: SAM-dependent methyltransferase [Paenibacillus sp.]|nr:SAM-dependent methyltransferase [Paenibacillus sp.]
MRNWYEESFGDDYLQVYSHRSQHEALHQVKKMIGWLKLPANSHILDLCCGAGRHALALVEAGFRMTGIDLSPHLLNEARKADKNRQINWIESDMRHLPEEADLQGKFDAVINLFTSFGYFEEDEEQIQVLREIRKALKPCGRFMMDLLNEGFVREHLIPYSKREVNGISISETRSLVNGFVVKDICIDEEGKPSRHYRERVKLYSLSLMTDMLEGTGLRVDYVYGDYQENVYDAWQSPRMIIVGQRV